MRLTESIVNALFRHARPTRGASGWPPVTRNSEFVKFFSNALPPAIGDYSQLRILAFSRSDVTGQSYRRRINGLADTGFTTMKDWHSTFVSPEEPILTALAAIDRGAMQIVLVVDSEHRLLGVCDGR